MADVSEQDVQELRFRQVLGRSILKVLRAAKRAGEPGAAEAIATYTAQLRAIRAELMKRRREEREAQGVAKPAPVEVGLRAARMGAKGR
jgi:hypothetical protein